MRKVRTLLLLALVASLVVGCAPIPEDPSDARYVSASFMPLYALAMNVVEGVEGLSLSCLIQPQDGCLRLYVLSDWDLALALGQDILILGGRGLESFETTFTALQTGPALIASMDGLLLLDDGESAVEDDLVNHLHGPNPWLYLSVEGAKQIAESIACGMSALDAPYEARYSANLAAYLERLDELRTEMARRMEGVPRKNAALLHEGLIYLADELGLTVSTRFNREPGSDWIDNDLDTLLAALAESQTEVVLLEAQAPAHLTEALSAAGYRVAAIDTLTGAVVPGDLNCYERVMLRNVDAIVAAMNNE